MSSYTQLLYQIVFSTKNRDPVLFKEGREELFKYIWGIIKNKKSVLYQINGVDDHLHIVTHIHQSIAVADFVKVIKVSSTKMIKETGLFPAFKGWQTGYGVFTYTISSKESLIDYVKNQEMHHQMKGFREEYLELLTTHGVDFKEEYLL